MVVLVLVVRSYNDKQEQKRIKDAAFHYQHALSVLKESPDDTEVRQETLRLGRRYTDLARADKRTTFDEVALMNDLNAIQPTSPPPSAYAGKSAESTEQRLTKLDQLRSKGMIIDEEYRERRSAILDEI